MMKIIHIDNMVCCYIAGMALMAFYYIRISAVVSYQATLIFSAVQSFDYYFSVKDIYGGFELLNILFIHLITWFLVRNFKFQCLY